MDPDEALVILRAAIEDWKRNKRSGHNYVGTVDAVYVIVEQVENLDEWLSKGGFLPRAWDDRTAAVSPTGHRFLPASAALAACVVCGGLRREHACG